MLRCVTVVRLLGTVERKLPVAPKFRAESCSGETGPRPEHDVKLLPCLHVVQIEHISESCLWVDVMRNCEGMWFHDAVAAGGPLSLALQLETLIFRLVLPIYQVSRQVQEFQWDLQFLHISEMEAGCALIVGL